MEKFSSKNAFYSILPVAKPGYPFIFGTAFVTVIMALSGMAAAALLSLAATIFVCYFFRDPDRIIPQDKNAVLSPADGRILSVLQTQNERFFDGPCLKISIFMSVFNVHVNRVPCDGEVVDLAYHPGKFFSANLDKASEENEHNAVFIKTKEDLRICVVQIAGLIARRIICKLQAGDEVRRGERFGMICFGSRLDVYLPPSVQPVVAVGDKVQAGVSILGVLR